MERLQDSTRRSACDCPDRPRGATPESRVTDVDVDRQPFDLGKLSCRIDELSEERGLTMAALAREVGVGASTIRRFRTADDAEADGVLALVAWTGDPPEQFIADSLVSGTPLPLVGTSQIRVDMDLVIGERTGRRAPTRTTIQRLVIAAQDSGQTVASLTRRSQV